MNPFGDATGFLIAGYGLTWAALLIYTWRVERRLGEARRALDGLDGGKDGGVTRRGRAPGSRTGVEPGPEDEREE